MNGINTILIILVAVIFAACAPGNPLEQAAAPQCMELAGFWSGFWHGLVAFFSFFGSLFDASIGIYNPCNNGGWYDFGFTFGAGILSSSGGGAVSSASKRRRR